MQPHETTNDSIDDLYRRIRELEIRLDQIERTLRDLQRERHAS